MENNLIFSMSATVRAICHLFTRFLNWRFHSNEHTSFSFKKLCMQDYSTNLIPEEEARAGLSPNGTMNAEFREYGS